MSTQQPPAAALAADLSEDQKHRLEEFIEEEEGAHNRYKGWLAAVLVAVAVAVGTSAFHLYAAYGIVRTELPRAIHVGPLLIAIGVLLHVGRVRVLAPA